jgi:hypothetical protein
MLKQKLAQEIENGRLQQSLQCLPYCTLLYSTLYHCKVHAVQSEIPISVSLQFKDF